MKHDLAKSSIDLSKLYIERAIPGPGKSNTSYFFSSLPSSDVHLTSNLPFPGTKKSVALYWSPKACLPIINGSVQDGTSLGIFLQIIGGKGGGGRKDFAQAGGQDSNKIDEALEKLKTLI